MVRLMLTLTPVVCVLASIAFSVTLDNYIHTDAIPIDDGEEEEAENEEEQKEINNEKKKVRIHNHEIAWKYVCIFSEMIGYLEALFSNRHSCLLDLIFVGNIHIAF